MNKKYIAITRPLSESNKFQKQLESLGVNVFVFPSIVIRKNTLGKSAIKSLQDIGQFDIVLFTSRNGVRFFMEALLELGIDTSILNEKYIAAVGPKTAEEIKKYSLPLHFIPLEFTTENLGRELKNVRDKKVLLPRANIASKKLTQQLEKKGALVTNIPIYSTEFIAAPSVNFEKLLEKNQVLCITFTSPSTVRGFIQNTKSMKMDNKIFSLPVVSIGPVTTKFLKKNKFTHIFTADTFTTEGMLTKIKENIL